MDLNRWYIGELSSLDDISFSTTSMKCYSDLGCKASMSLSSLRVLTGETDLKGRGGVCFLEQLPTALALDSRRCCVGALRGVSISLPGGELACASSSVSIAWHMWKCGRGEAFSRFAAISWISCSYECFSDGSCSK